MTLFSLPFIRTYREISPRITIYIVHFFFIIVALFLQAYMHNFNIVYISLFIIFGLAMSSCHFGRTNIKHLSAHNMPEGRIFANTPAHIHFKIANASTNPAYDLHVTCNDSSVSVPQLNHEYLLKIPLTFTQRGDKILEALQVESGFPLPHLRFRRTLSLRKQFCVYPEPKGIPLAQFLSEHESFHGERNDFEGVRSYEPSDMPSLIHWPSLAKSGELASRHFSYLHHSEILQFDFSSAGDDDASRLSQLCLWVLECEHEARSFSITMSETILNHPKESIDAILLTLARY